MANRSSDTATPPNPRSVSNGRALVLAIHAAVAVACYDPATLPEPTPYVLQAPQLQIPDTGTADGASLLPLTVVIDPRTEADKRTIALTATAGSFAASSNQTTTVIPDATGAAHSLLRAPGDSMAVVVTATVDGVSVSRTVIYRRALPEFIDIVPGQRELLAGPTHELGLTAFLRRTVGKPSPHLRVNFSAVESGPNGKAIGDFLPLVAVTDEDGVATTKLTIADSTRRGSIAIRATISPAAVVGEVLVNVTGPDLTSPADSTKKTGS